MSDKNTRLVYSTEQNVPRKESPVERAVPTNLPPAQQKVIVRLDRKGRGGKSVTVIDGLLMHREQLESLLKQLKGKLGTGGSVKDTSLELQGDKCTALIAALQKMGYKPKRSGG